MLREVDKDNFHFGGNVVVRLEEFSTTATRESVRKHGNFCVGSHSIPFEVDGHADARLKEFYENTKKTHVEFAHLWPQRHIPEEYVDFLVSTQVCNFRALIRKEHVPLLVTAFGLAALGIIAS